jgi:hypothetical protein
MNRLKSAQRLIGENAQKAIWLCLPEMFALSVEAMLKSRLVFRKRHVYSFTTVFQAPEGYEDQTPYTAIIKLEEGPLITAGLTDVDRKNVWIDMPVEMVTRKIVEDGDRGAIFWIVRPDTPLGARRS